MLDYYFSPEDMVLLHMITTWSWWIGLATAAFYIYKRSHPANKLDMDPNTQAIHVHGGIAVNGGNSLYELGVCIKINFTQNILLLTFHLSHPIFPMFLVALTAYYSIILPFMFSLIFLRQKFEYTLNLSWVISMLKYEFLLATIQNNSLFARMGMIPTETTPAAAPVA